MSEKQARPISVFSEIGNLETVLLHRPGRELTNLHPDHLERLLFDDVPDLDIAQREHLLATGQTHKHTHMITHLLMPVETHKLDSQSILTHENE